MDFCRGLEEEFSEIMKPDRPMIAQSISGQSILLFFLLCLVNSCALPGLSKDLEGPAIYYAVPPVTYIRELPGYASRPVSTAYHGDQVTVLSKMAAEDWCRVQTATGEQGWMQRALLSPVPLRVETYLVQAPEVPLRSEPLEEVISRQVLHRGDEVKKLAENDQGWWLVLVEKDKSLGWLPAAALTAQPPREGTGGAVGRPLGEAAAEPVSALPTAPAAKNYFVAVNSLELHLLPLAGSKVVKVLKLNDRVEEVSQSGPQWRKVKYPPTGAQGWTLASFLSESAVKAPRPGAGQKKKAPARPRVPDQKKPLLDPQDQEPEIM